MNAEFIATVTVERWDSYNDSQSWESCNYLEISTVTDLVVKCTRWYLFHTGKFENVYAKENQCEITSVLSGFFRG